MSKFQIYHNPSCSTSNKAMQLLKEQGIEAEPILYLKDTPSANELKELLRKLGLPAEALVRKKEAIYKELFAGKQYTDDEWIELFTRYPKLIERPVVIKGDKAVIGRPIEKINELIKKK